MSNFRKQLLFQLCQYYYFIFFFRINYSNQINYVPIISLIFNQVFYVTYFFLRELYQFVFGTNYFYYINYVTIMSLIFNQEYYLTYFFWHQLCPLFLFVFIMSVILLKTYYVTYSYSNILYAFFFQCILCQFFVWQYIISIIFNYFIPIELIDIIARPLPVALHVALCPQRPSLSLHIAGPSQCPCVDKPHPASVSRTRPAVAGRSWKASAKAVGNGSSVAYWNHRQFSKDTFNWNDVDNWFFVI